MSRTKAQIKKLLQRIMPSRHPAFLVASFGRAGSTLIYNALIDGMARKCFGSGGLFKKVITDTAWDLEKQVLIRGVVYKTHDYPSGLTDKANVKSIFLFGSMLDSALSVYSQMTLRGEGWIAEHFHHLKSTDSFENLLRRDALGFMKQAQAWVGFESVPVLCLRYEALWDHRADLSEYCGFEVEFPEWRPRSNAPCDEAIVAAAREIYSPLDAKLAMLPDCFIAKPSMAALLANGPEPSR